MRELSDPPRGQRQPRAPLRSLSAPPAPRNYFMLDVPHLRANTFSVTHVNGHPQRHRGQLTHVPRALCELGLRRAAAPAGGWCARDGGLRRTPSEQTLSQRLSSLRHNVLPDVATSLESTFCRTCHLSEQTLSQRQSISPLSSWAHAKRQSHRAGVTLRP